MGFQWKKQFKFWGRAEMVLHSLLCQQRTLLLSNRNPKIWQRSSTNNSANPLLEQAEHHCRQLLYHDIKAAFQHEIVNCFMGGALLLWDKPGFPQGGSEDGNAFILTTQLISSKIHLIQSFHNIVQYKPAPKSHFSLSESRPETTGKPGAFLSVHRATSH